MTTTDNYELYHFGILGMKWGIRRFQNEDGTLTPAGKIRYRNDDGSYTEAGKLKVSKGKTYSDDYWNAHDKKKVEYMTDKEVQDRVKRLSFEKKYKEMIRSPKQKALDTVKKETANVGRRFVEGAIVGVALQYAVTKMAPVTNKYMDKGLKYVSQLLKNLKH